MRVLVGMSFTVAVGYGIVAPVLPVFARSFDVGLTATSTVIGAFAVVRILFAPLSGRLVEKLGELPLLFLGLLIVGVSSLACAAATEFWQLLVFRAAGGIGSTFFTVSSDLMLFRMSPRTMLGRASAALAGAFLLGSVVGPVAGAVLVPWGDRLPFIVYGGLLVVATAVVALFLAACTPPHVPQERLVASGATTFWTACKTRAFRAALASNFLDGWTVHGIRVVLVPVFVTEMLDRTSSWAAASLALFAAGTAAGLPIAGWMADQIGRRLPSLLGTTVLAATAVWLGLSSSIAEFLVASALSGVGTGLIAPPANAAVGDLVNRQPTGGRGGAALAGFQMVGDAGAVVGPLLVGVVADLGGYPIAFSTAAVVAGVALVGWSRVDRRGAS
ncbi:MFS transporter [Pseudonocardia endophytica]|uniref:MFS transporter n=1 Tax=Pseudonocardia endophytica TaxID=401976 RepID=UPI00104B0AE8|nr:MFS transporter [Pseudonocardia endophytica]